MRTALEVQADLDEVNDKIRRLEDQVKTIGRSGVESDGQSENAARVLRGLEKAEERREALHEELGEVVRGEKRAGVRNLVRSGRGGRENGDGASLDEIGPGRGRFDPAGTDVVRSQALRHLDDLSRNDEFARWRLTPEVGDHLDALIRRSTGRWDGSYLAERLLLTENPLYRSAFEKYIGAGMTGQPLILSDAEARSVDALRQLEVRRAASENTTTAGGFGVPVMIDSTVIISSGAADVPLLRVCRIEQVTNNLWKGVSSAGMSWSYDTEAAEVSDDTPVLAQPSVTVHMARGYIPYSIEVGMDYPNFAAEMMRVLDQGYTDLLAQKTMTGTGTGEPKGIFTALDANTNCEVVTTTDGSFGGPDVFKVWNALPERYRSRATWVMSVHVQSAVRQFAAAATANSAYYTIDLTGGTFRINERPVIITDYAPTFASGVPGTTGAANILAVGDFSNYLLAQRAGMSVETVPLVIGSSQRPTGQRGLFAWARNGADFSNPLGARLLQNQ